ncbi:thioesterase family protein [Frankia sp. CNm7]|uniref:Thioesterase family protein n=1 Tax=Frankia nepalensis TaxID=1836974 RepID=A0A937RIX2_9ACTN|nr:acyl-CoA thioesterase domain-containing protein [Frankia nepalensis]MBL7497645.1 thioesterase family protein [Frankia nepalensis]MBL7510041.1 thioesterase family protein [Frankia nepalensis]MBL7517549.1 thioesterase family protein [Frankia nepalensis]MBL7631062.1 thioesterase family protein [Frankia nepalensis]
MSIDLALRHAILESLDGLLRAFDLETLGDDRFLVRSEPPRFNRIFGGQTLAQALVAAGATVDGKAFSSLHASFVAAGAPDAALELAVDRVRDGRSMATRRVTVLQGDRVLLVAIVTFHASPAGGTPPGAGTPGARPARTPAPVPEPERLPLLQDWARKAPPAFEPTARAWVDHPPPIEMRLDEAPIFMGGSPATDPRDVWMRLPRDVGADPGLHAALLTYASDYLLLDMAFRSFPEGLVPDFRSACSLDHAIWLHQPVRFDRWHRHTQETVVVAGDRGLVRGAIHDADGRLVATVAQDVLARPLAVGR